MFMMAGPSKKPRRECSFQKKWQTCSIYSSKKRSTNRCSYWHDIIGKMKTLEGNVYFLYHILMLTQNDNSNVLIKLSRVSMQSE